MTIEEQYLNSLKELVQLSTQPHQFKGDRTGTGTYGTFGKFFKHDMKLGFPIMTTRKMPFRIVVSELLWFMQGRTDLQTLVKDKNNIWVGDAYKKYVNFEHPENYQILSREEFIEKIISDDDFSDKHGQLGAIYGASWRGYHGQKNMKLVNYLAENNAKPNLFVDQLSNAVEELRINPYGRRILVDSWNVELLPFMTLPPCHILFQFGMEAMSNQEKKANPGYHQKLSLIWFQRSADSVLGVPTNISSYALLLELIARMVPGTKANQLFGSFGDYHLYSNHIEQAKLQISREPMPLPTLTLDIDSMNFSGTLDDLLNSITDHRAQIQLDGYISHSRIDAPLSN